MMGEITKIRCGLVSVILAAALVSCDEDPDSVADPGDTAVADASDAADADGADVSGDVDAEVDVDPPEPGEFDFSPTQVTFEGARIGEAATATVALINIGESSLHVTNLHLAETDLGDGDELTPGEDWIEDNLEIPPNIREEITVTLDPTDRAVDSGYLDVTVITDSQTTHRIPIDSINAYADIDAPSLLRLGEVASGESETRLVAIHNRGEDVLTIDNVELAGSGAFSYEMRTGSQVPAALERDDYIRFDVTFAPSNDERQTATITIDSSDPDEGTHEITLLGNEEGPCIHVSPRSVDFGVVETGTVAEETVTMVNCNESRTLEIAGVEFNNDGGGAFSAELPETTPIDLLPRQTAEVTLVARNDAVREALGSLTIESDDAEQSVILVDVRAFFGAPQ